MKWRIIIKNKNKNKEKSRKKTEIADVAQKKKRINGTTWRNGNIYLTISINPKLGRDSLVG